MDAHLNVPPGEGLDALSPPGESMHMWTPTADALADHGPAQGGTAANRIGGPVPDPVEVSWPPALLTSGEPADWDTGRGPATSEPTSWDAPPFQMPPGQQDSTPSWDPPGGEVTRLGGDDD